MVHSSLPAQSSVPAEGTCSRNGGRANARPAVPDWRGLLKFLPCLKSRSGSCAWHSVPVATNVSTPRERLSGIVAARPSPSAGSSESHTLRAQATEEASRGPGRGGQRDPVPGNKEARDVLEGDKPSRRLRTRSEQNSNVEALHGLHLFYVPMLHLK